MKLTTDQRIAVDGMVRRFGAANLDVQCRRNKSSWTVGFRCFEPDGTRYHIESCFTIPLEQELMLPDLLWEIECYLNACIDDPSRAHGKVVPDGSPL